ncbi:PBSX family phage terminase large subunit [Bacillus sp. AFS017336]|uniref:PBSX family phage terminase large subunit n=1 Tax=Bacillus sp. AFS017336 TaxID=2033489 RepID=UPI000BF14516|nr:PBSX family phage terminase large subunit [Bacillus sp. AFS017336]PEL12712.1 PBSX family phage terminase large subunit [Bacillus sp. AFS017336]
MRIKKRREKAFKFKSFSKKQLKLLWFWRDGSPYEDMDMVIADGAIRSGKTISMICSFLQWSQSTYKGESFIVAGKSIGSLKRNVIKPMMQILQAWGWNYQYNRSENYIVIGSNTYYLFGANTEASQDTLQGLTAAGAFGDEIALFPKSFTDQMIGRCSVDGAKVFMNCNPKGPHHYFKTEFIDKAKEKKILYLKFTMDDNLSLAESVKERFRRMFSGVFFQRYILGLWVNAEGLIYDMFLDKKHVVKTIDREYEQYYVSCDYGTQNPFALGLWGLHKGVWYKTKEYHYDGRKKAIQKTDNEYLDALNEFVTVDDKMLANTIIIDPSASSFIALLKKHVWRVKKANNDVLEGIRNVASALNEESIKYNDCCKETFKEFSSYIWDEKALERGEDKPKKEHDHQMDSDRYFVNTVLKKPKNFQPW